MSDEKSLVERVAPPEPMSDLAGLPTEVAIIKMQNDTVMSLAKAEPRDLKKIGDELVAMIESTPEFADDCVYVKPVGKDKKTGRQKFAEGLSIRAAEHMAELYKYNSIRRSINIIDDTKVRLTVTFVDHQAGRTWVEEGIVSKTYHKSAKWGGGVGYIPEDRFYNVVVKAEFAKLVREAISRSMPILRARVLKAAQNRLAKSMEEGQRLHTLAIFVDEHGLNQQHLEAIVGKPLANWTIRNHVRLRGIYAALRDGETTVSELLDEARESGERPPPYKAPVATPAGDALKTAAAVKDHAAPTDAVQATVTKGPEPEPVGVGENTPTPEPSEPSGAPDMFGGAGDPPKDASAAFRR